MRLRQIIGFVIVAVFGLALTVGSCVRSNDSTPDTTLPLPTLPDLTTTVPPADTEEESPDDSTTQAAAYCEAQSTLASITISSLDNEQAVRATVILNKVYASFPNNMKQHAGPLLDYFMQSAQMGGGGNAEMENHLTELNKLLDQNC